MTSHVDILIIGAGPAGLGAATRLTQHNPCGKSWLLLDSVPHAGGLATTDTTEEGFMFDIGAHVIFSHYQYFDDVLDAAVSDWNIHQRACYVRIKGRWVAYPFQNNIAVLDTDDQIKCLQGLVEAQNKWHDSKPANFDEWILRNLGEGIAEIFMRPYNFKVWAYPTTEMQSEWLGERVSKIDINKAIGNVLQSKEELGWGPNAVFRYPQRGGTGAIWKAVAAMLPDDHLQLGPSNQVTHIDIERKVVKLIDGSTLSYGSLISTMHLDKVCKWVGREDWATGLLHSSTNIVGIGIRGVCPHESKCWLYFPEDNCPYYRCTVFSNFSSDHCPEDDVKLPTLWTGKDGPDVQNQEAKCGPYWSLIFEISESEKKPVTKESVVIGGKLVPSLIVEAMRGAIASGMMRESDEIVSTYFRRFEHGYPTPSLFRDKILQEALPFFKSKGVYQRGRFGTWKYEVANQDHSFMLGVEAVDNILFGGYEMTLENPDWVNQRRNTDLRWNR